MQTTTASIRYAKALFQLAIGDNMEKEILMDLQLVSNLLKTEESLKQLINNPTVKQNVKIRVFKRLFNQKLNTISINFLTLVLKKGREIFLIDIVNKYEEIYNQHKKISVVEVMSAQPIAETLKEKIKEKTSVDGGSVQLKEKVDRSLLGGFIIKRGDLQYDATIRKKLNNAKRAFKL